MQFINYSPVGIVKTIAENIGKGKFDQRMFAQGIGRGITGTGVLYLVKSFTKKVNLWDTQKTKENGNSGSWKGERKMQ